MSTTLGQGDSQLDGMGRDNLWMWLRTAICSLLIGFYSSHGHPWTLADHRLTENMDPCFAVAGCEPENVTAISDEAYPWACLSTMLRRVRPTGAWPQYGTQEKLSQEGIGSRSRSLQHERTLGWYLNVHVGGAFPRVIVVECHHSSRGHRVTPATSSASLCKTVRSSHEDRQISGDSPQCPKGYA